MIRKQLAAIEEEDLLRLVSDKTPESRTLDYKKQFPSGDHLIAIAQDITAMANSAGGDIIVGVQEGEGDDKGVPVAVTGLADNYDVCLQSIENVIRDRVEPPLSIGTRRVQLPCDRWALVIRITRSWSRPHGVRDKKSYSFHSRNNIGNAPMDIAQIRSAFLGEERMAEKIREFRETRLKDIAGTPFGLPATDYSRIVLHAVPLAAYDAGLTVDLQNYFDASEIQSALSYYARQYRFNLEGVLGHRTLSRQAGGTSYYYVQAFRNGVLEAVDAARLSPDLKGQSIHIFHVEDAVVRGVNAFVEAMKIQRVDPPILLFVSFLGIEGLIFVGSDGFDIHKFDAKELLLPEVLITDLEDQLRNQLKSVLDILSQASGLRRSPSYDRNGNWTRHQNF